MADKKHHIGSDLHQREEQRPVVHRGTPTENESIERRISEQVTADALERKLRRENKIILHEETTLSDTKHDVITIKRSEYEALLADSRFLHALQACGVDNWNGYAEAHNSLEDNEP